MFPERKRKSHCRQKVKGVSAQLGMDAAPSIVSGIAKRSWLFRYIDLFATRVNHQVPAFVSWRPEPEAVATYRCFQCKMGFSSGLPIPSFLYDRKISQKDSTGSVALCSDHTGVEKQTLVSIHSVSLGRAIMASSKTTGSSKTSRHQKDTPRVLEKLQAGCMAHFRETLTKKGFSQKVSDILHSSWRKKTASQYESAWKAWNSWCSEREINPFSATLENIFEFLADLFHKGLSFIQWECIGQPFLQIMKQLMALLLGNIL